MVVLMFSIGACLFSIAAIRSKYSGPAWLHYLSKPLTMLLIIAMALQSAWPVDTVYAKLIIIGLIFSLAGDIFLMLPSDRFIPGLVSFLIAHLCYIAAFHEGHAFFTPWWPLIPLAGYGGFMLKWLWPHLRDMKIPVVIYMAAILVMGWQAGLHGMMGTTNSRFALVGALFFIASDSVLALDRFRGQFRSAQFWILSTYFIAQWCISLSV